MNVCHIDFDFNLGYKFFFKQEYYLIVLILFSIIWILKIKMI